jgi:hypothetical protein
VPTVNVPNDLFKTLRFVLQKRGVPIEGLSHAGVVRKALEIFIQPGYVPPLEGEISEVLGPNSKNSQLDVRGQVAAFAAKYDWSQAEEPDTPLAPNLREALAIAREEVQLECSYSHQGAEILCEEAPPAEPAPLSFPPWQGLKRYDLEELKLMHPRHKLLVEACKSPVQQLAVECALGMLPTDLHTETKAFLTYQGLLKLFQTYIKEKGCKIVLKKGIKDE